MKESERVLVVGSINRDVVTRVPSIPRAGQTLAGEGDGIARLGGKGANQAVAAARLGGPATLVGAVGVPDGATVLEQLQRLDVDTTWVRMVDQPTGWAHVLIAPNGENAIIVDPGANRFLTDAQIAEAIDRTGPRVVVAQLEIGGRAAAKALQLGRRSGAMTICNASPSQQFAAIDPADVDVLVVNQSEALDIAGAVDEAAARRLVDLTGNTVLVTLGPDGALVADPAGVRQIAAVRAAKVVDTTGAGDVFTGALAHDLACGCDLVVAVDRAQRAASWVVGRIGTAGPQPADL